MNYFVEGILFGFTLTILLGPIFIALTQTAIEKGGRAGLTVATGVWCSDILIISSCYIFIKALSNIVENDAFNYWMGMIGGIVLIIFGLGSFFAKIDLDAERKKHTSLHYAGFWLKGFLVNTINPFTFIFWIGIISTYIIGRKISPNESFIFLGSIMLTIFTTDILKVYGAKMIRDKLKSHHIMIFGRLAGVGLIIFGMFLIYRVSYGIDM